MKISKLNLKGKVVIVTGGAWGIGRSIALASAKAGADVATGDILTAENENTAAQIKKLGRKALATTTDVTDSSQVDDMVRKTLAEFGQIDVLVNNVGPQPRPEKALWEMSDELWQSEMDVVLTSAFYCCRAVAKHMVERKQGKIINIASGFGLRGLRHQYTYCTGKGGMIQLTKTLALTWARDGIKVNCIAPGFIGVKHSYTEEEEEFLKERGRFVPVGYVGDPDEIAELAVLMASEAGDYMTGAVVIMDGGAMAAGYAPTGYERTVI